MNEKQKVSFDPEVSPVPNKAAAEAGSMAVEHVVAASPEGAADLSGRRGGVVRNKLATAAVLTEITNANGLPAPSLGLAQDMKYIGEQFVATPQPLPPVQRISPADQEAVKALSPTGGQARVEVVQQPPRPTFQ